MQAGLGTAVGTYPAAGDPAFATSGLAIGVETLAGTPFLVDEAVGDGRVIAFSIDPNFRAWTQGTQRLLWNAIVGPDPAGFGPGLLAGSRARAAAEKAALDAASKLPNFGSAIRIRVARTDAAAAAKILSRRGSDVVRIDLGSETLFLVANRRDLSYEEHPFFGLLIRELETRRDRPSGRQPAVGSARRHRHRAARSVRALAEATSAGTHGTLAL